MITPENIHKNHHAALSKFYTAVGRQAHELKQYRWAKVFYKKALKFDEQNKYTHFLIVALISATHPGDFMRIGRHWEKAFGAGSKQKAEALPEQKFPGCLTLQN